MLDAPALNAPMPLKLQFYGKDKKKITMLQATQKKYLTGDNLWKPLDI